MSEIANEEARLATRRESETRPIPWWLRWSTIFVALFLARRMSAAVIPKEAHPFWHVFGGAAIVGLIGAVFWFLVVVPVRNHIARRKRA